MPMWTIWVCGMTGERHGHSKFRGPFRPSPVEVEVARLLFECLICESPMDHTSPPQPQVETHFLFAAHLAIPSFVEPVGQQSPDRQPPEGAPILNQMAPEA